MSTYRAIHPQDLTSYGVGWDVERQKFFLWVDIPTAEVGADNPRVWFFDDIDSLIAKAKEHGFIIHDRLRVKLLGDRS